MARNNERRDRSAERDEPELLEKLVGINRVAKVVTFLISILNIWLAVKE